MKACRLCSHHIWIVKIMVLGVHAVPFVYFGLSLPLLSFSRTWSQSLTSNRYAAKAKLAFTLLWFHDAFPFALENFAHFSLSLSLLCYILQPQWCNTLRMSSGINVPPMNVQLTHDALHIHALLWYFVVLPQLVQFKRISFLRSHCVDFKEFCVFSVITCISVTSILKPSCVYKTRTMHLISVSFFNYM